MKARSEQFPPLRGPGPDPAYGMNGSSLYAGNPRRAMKSPPHGVRPAMIGVFPF